LVINRARINGANIVELEVWVEDNCQILWKMLNNKSRARLPIGFVKYIGCGSLSEIKSGRSHMSSIDRKLNELEKACGWQMLSDKYRSDLSGVNSENQVAELFCEIALCASLAKRAQKLVLRPSTGKGTYSDCFFNLKGFDIYGEVKRYVDPWPHIETIGESTNEKIPYKRSISKAPPDEKPDDSARPRSMDLRSKLLEVHKQLPNGTLNILFLFHSSFGENRRYLTQTFFGDSNFFKTKSDFVLEDDGLFSLDEWKNISACCLCHVNPDSKVVFKFFWKNPRAEIALPEIICKELKA
jgi:hypothetical protein